LVELEREIIYLLWVDMWCAYTAYSPPRLIAEPARKIIYKHGHRLVLPCHAVGEPQPT